MRFAIALTLTISVLGASSITSRGNLRDTLNQSISRYGEPICSKGNYVATGGGTYAFQKGEFEYDVLFKNGIIFQEVVWKPGRKPLTESEQKAILEANVGNGKWTPHSQYWINSEGAVAKYYPTVDSNHPCNCMIVALGTAQ